MAKKANSNERWLVAAWPGMGHVATTAAVYLLSKLRMALVTEFQARDLFELESVEVRAGLLHAARLPRSRLFLWRNPAKGRDIVVFLGEAQPPTGKLALCQRLVDEARALGVTRFYTFSAMATEMQPGGPSKTFGVASSVANLRELERRGVAVLKEGRIGGLNGVALAAAAEAGLPAVGLLGEMPALAPQLPYPSASAAVLGVFKELAGLDLDLAELEEYGRAMQQQLTELYSQVEKALQPGEPAQPGPGGEEAAAPPAPAKPAAPPADADLDEEELGRIERLFKQAARDRSKAFELKRELDRLGVFRRFEDRFLDLFEPKSPS